jgi:acetyl-CoA synthetase
MSQKIQSLSGYFHEYQKSMHQPEEFWSRIAKNFHWKKPWDKVLSWDFEGPDIKWFENAQLNITENIFERHLFTHGDKTAIIWEPNDPEEAERRISYKELFELSCQFSNALERQGIQKGDRVIIYMPMIPEAAIAMLACARVGAVHSVVFAGFSSNALADRINDCEAKMVLTSDGNFRGAKNIAVKAVVDEALEKTSCVEKVIVCQRTKTAVTMKADRDLWWHELIQSESKEHTAASLRCRRLTFYLIHFRIYG